MAASALPLRHAATLTFAIVVTEIPASCDYEKPSCFIERTSISHVLVQLHPRMRVCKYKIYRYT